MRTETMTSVELVLLILCIYKCNGANERYNGNSENTRNLGISLNTGILDVPSGSVDSGSSRYPRNSPSEFPETSTGNRRRAPQDEYEFSRNFQLKSSEFQSRGRYQVSRGSSAGSFQDHRRTPEENQQFYDTQANKNAQDKRLGVNHQDYPSSSSTPHQSIKSPTNELHGFLEGWTVGNGQGTIAFGNAEDPIRPKPNQDANQGNRRLPQSSKQRSHYDSNNKEPRRPGQSGFQGNDGEISSGVNIFTGNVNVGRAQVSRENSGAYRSQENANSQSQDNRYSSRIDDVDDDGARRHDPKAAHGDEVTEDHDVTRPEILSGYGENVDDGSNEDSRKSITNLQESDGSEQLNADRGFLGRSEESRSTTMRPAQDNYGTSSTGTYRRKTTRPKNESELGCRLPHQPPGGHYDLGGCNSPCDKEPGDLVPNTSVLTYTCDNGFVRNGSAVSVCLNDSWYMPPSCLKTCPPLESTSVDITCKLRGSKVACDAPVEPATHATLACKPSYKIPLTEDPAYREITCTRKGSWDRILFRCLPKCGTTIAHGSTLVVNGFTAKVGVFPWHVGIYEKKSRHVYEQICAGTLINSNLVVSAAHCFYDDSINEPKPVSKFYAAAGKHYRSWSRDEDYAQKSRIERINIAKRYIGARGNFAQDIALLELKTPFELTDLVHPVCLDWDNVLEREHLQVGRYGKAVGWGKTENGEASEELRGINVPFVSFDQCVADVPEDFRGYITPDKFCAGYRNGSSLCEGDSGGGLFFESNGLWYLRGIVSVSPVRDHSCDYQSYTGFTYFSHFRDWIRTAFLET
uniref:LFC_1 protein n=1 Tax=Fopius arisanus TaxID=64838 RepID=A0A0C9PLQ9_9HYME